VPDPHEPGYLELARTSPLEGGVGPHAEELVVLGARLRELRANRNVSLRAVADASGITASMLSQVERGIVAPSLNTLYALSSYFQVGLFELFLEDTTDPGLVIRKAERRKVSFPGSSETYDVLTPSGEKGMAVLELVVPPDRGAFEHGLSHQGTECAVVLSGTAILRLGSAVHEMEEGDSIFFQATVPHQYECGGTDPATILVFTTPAI
jgi:transcriptional regulator with XRE-family HTH domain